MTFNKVLMALCVGVLAWVFIRSIVYIAKKQAKERGLEKKPEKERSDFKFKDPMKPRDYYD